MLRSFYALLVALIAGWALVGSATTASAHYRHSGCCGGPIPPTYVYKTVHKVSRITRYHDVSRTKYVYRIHPIVHVTRVQPVVYVHAVTRVHHHIVSVVRPVYRRVTQYLPPRRVVTHSVKNTYNCVCTYHCR